MKHDCYEMDMKSDSGARAPVAKRLNRVSQELATFLHEQVVNLSPQLARKLAQLLSCLSCQPPNLHELLHRIESVYDRLLLELIQAQYNTKQREQDLIRLVESIGCSIRNPALIDQVIELLIRLYKAAGQCSDTSFERQVLIKYILKELGNTESYGKRQVEKVVQTIYRCSCFLVSQQDEAPSRLSLKENLYDSSELRCQLDVELINLAQANCIRLSPESWAYLLHGRSTQDNISKMQSTLRKCQTPVSVNELRVAIFKSGDKLGLEQFLGDLLYIQDLICQIRIASSSSSQILTNLHKSHDSNDNNRDDGDSHHCNMSYRICDILDKLVELEHLFTARQHRARPIYNK